jgi:hypothetical protein
MEARFYGPGEEMSGPIWIDMKQIRPDISSPDIESGQLAGFFTVSLNLFCIYKHPFSFSFSSKNAPSLTFLAGRYSSASSPSFQSFSFLSFSLLKSFLY